MAEPRLSQHTFDLIERLIRATPRASAPLRLIQRFFLGDDKRLELIHEIAEQGESIAAAWLFPYALEPSPEIAIAAAKAISQLLIHATSEDVLWLERRRSWCEWEWRYPDRRASVEDLDLPRIPAEYRPAVWCLATLNWRGHVREAAIEKLLSTLDVFAIPFVLLRLNDWVQEVRIAAKRFLSLCMSGTRVDDIARHLMLVCRLAECGRDDHSSLVRSIVGYALSRPDSLDLGALLNGPHRFSRRVIFRIASEIDGPHREHLADMALSCSDVTIRLQAVCKLPELVRDESNLQRRLNELAKSDLTSVRRAVLAVTCRRFPDDAESHLLAVLFDPSEQIREFAQYALRQRGFNDLAAGYRSALSNERLLATAVSGLGQTGTSEDAPLIEPQLNSSRPKVRRAAVTAIGRLLGDNGLRQILPMLNDSSARVGRAAFAVLAKRTHLISATNLEAMMASAPEHSQILIVELFDKMALWDSFPCLLRTIASARNAVANRACELLMSRLNRVFTTPTSAQRQQLERLLDEKGVALPQSLLARLREWLKYR